MKLNIYRGYQTPVRTAAVKILRLQYPTVMTDLGLHHHIDSTNFIHITQIGLQLVMSDQSELSYNLSLNCIPHGFNQPNSIQRLEIAFLVTFSHG